MIGRLLPSLTFLAAISCGLAAGIFYAFSSLVMRALARISPPAGIAAMQSINVSVVNPWFIAAFFWASRDLLCFRAYLTDAMEQAGQRLHLRRQRLLPGRHDDSDLRIQRAA